ncbi:MAG: 50S ribosomal protein L29 [Acidimicrobiales bacterium]
MADAADLRQFDDDELDNRLATARKELFNLRFQAATGRLTNSARVGQVRKEIARTLTVRRDREIAEIEGRLPEPAVERAVQARSGDEEE